MHHNEGTRAGSGRLQIIFSEAEQIAGRVLFIDGEAIVIDKPAGLAVDPPRAGGDSLARRLDELKFGFQRPPVPMHRLDRDTSGCLLLARNPKARARFAHAFETHSVEKVYLAVVERLRELHGVEDAEPIFGQEELRAEAGAQRGRGGTEGDDRD